VGWFDDGRMHGLFYCGIYDRLILYSMFNETFSTPPSSLELPMK
jgi:hypothetical protein